MTTLPQVNDTIVAILTPPGDGAIGVIRLSGDDAPQILSHLFTGSLPIDQFDSHRLYLGTLFDRHHAPLDQAMAVWMKAPHSFTGENVIELHCHGGRHLLSRALDSCLAHGARMAKPGEFSERAFTNGKIDLAQAEAICDLIRAKSDRALKLSFNTLAGHLSHTITDLKDRLIGIKAQLDASVDFPEEDLTPDDLSRLMERLSEIEKHIDALQASYTRGRLLKEGIKVALIGKPNVGKSSLMNALLKEERAIVHAEAGTTRDVIEETLTLSQVLIRLMDTAGIRDEAGPVEQEGIRRSEKILREADLVLVLLDGSRPLDREDERVIAQVTQHKQHQHVLWIRTKSDLPWVWRDENNRSLIAFSTEDPTALKALEAAMVDIALSSDAHDADACVITHARHYHNLLSALEAIQTAKNALNSGLSPEFASSDLNRALDALKEITGEITGEDILDKIFRDFCIGK